MSSGHGEHVEFHYEPSSSVTRQTKVDIGLSTDIPESGGTVSWSVGAEQIEEKGRAVSAPWKVDGSHHEWIWANYKFAKHKICHRFRDGSHKCWYEWHPHHFQGQLDDSNPNGCHKGEPRVCNPIGNVTLNEPPFTPGPSCGPQCSNWTVKIYQQNDINHPWTRYSIVKQENTGGGNLTLPFAGDIAVDSTSVYGKITGVEYSWISSSDCGSGKQRIVWGYKDDPGASKRVYGRCVDLSQLGN